jgi:hypothetical protein
MVQILSHSKRTGAQALSSAVYAKLATDWVISGQETVAFRVDKHKKTISAD